MTGSWQTTVAGWAAAVAIMASQIAAIFDGDPSTVFDLQAILTALGGLGIGVLGQLARADKVSSENAGAK